MSDQVSAAEKLNDISHEFFMEKAIDLARKAEEMDEVPIGCVIVRDGMIIGQGWNRRETDQQASAHAEMLAIEQACLNTGFWRLEDCDLYVTLEPCPMCAGAIIQSRIKKVYFGAYDPKGGSCGSVINLFEIPQYNHHPQYVGGILESDCSSLLTDFFRKRRIQNKKKKQSEKLKICRKPEQEINESNDLSSESDYSDTSQIQT